MEKKNKTLGTERCANIDNMYIKKILLLLCDRLIGQVVSVSRLLTKSSRVRFPELPQFQGSGLGLKRCTLSFVRTIWLLLA